MKEVLGEEEVLRIMSNAFTAEEIAKSSRKYSISEIKSAISDAKESGAYRWAWIAKRLKSKKNGKKKETK